MTREEFKKRLEEIENTVDEEMERRIKTIERDDIDLNMERKITKAYGKKIIILQLPANAIYEFHDIYKEWEKGIVPKTKEFELLEEKYISVLKNRKIKMEQEYNMTKMERDMSPDDITTPLIIVIIITIPIFIFLVSSSL